MEKLRCSTQVMVLMVPKSLIKKVRNYFCGLELESLWANRLSHLCWCSFIHILWKNAFIFLLKTYVAIFSTSPVMCILSTMEEILLLQAFLHSSVFLFCISVSIMFHFSFGFRKMSNGNRKKPAYAYLLQYISSLI